MENENHRSISGKALELLLGSLSQALEKEMRATVEEHNEQDSQAGETQNRVKKSKVYFCIGVNDVTRTLERMPKKEIKLEEIPAVKRLKLMDIVGEESGLQQTTSPPLLQVVLVAMDVHPRVLVSHLGPLCSSRAVPMLLISGGDGTGSLHLGELLGLRTAMTVGVKAGTSAINTAVQSILSRRP